jgi:hypothetical protein
MNRLAQETSPYLLQHADNPVDWHPWGEQALALAREQDKPILLSVGYSACHWCHVMAHESFEDAEVADAMNRLFINIKVDREERPDLDQIYQTAHQMLAGRPGGWPLTMFLTSEGTPFYGGTYFPKASRYGLPGFIDICKQIAEIWRMRRGDIEAQNRELLGALAGRAPSPSAASAELDATPIAATGNMLLGGFDRDFGGFGAAPKFPHPTDLAFLLRKRDDPLAREVALVTLTRMAEGGIYDQLGGGFCRYSTDERWEIPHFEKMLYDNGPLLGLYADAWALTQDALYRRVAEETVAWLAREMTSPEGAFYSSLDADSEGEEGRFYVWDHAEIERLLAPEEWVAAARRWGLDGPPNFENRHWHLRVVVPMGGVSETLSAEAERLLDSARARLFAAREKRVQPGRDDKILSSWNAQMIEGLAHAARVFDRPDWLAMARRALDFIRATLWRDGRLLATCKDGKAHLNAYLDDYAYLLAALLELLQAEYRGADLAFARTLADALLEHFEDREAGGFYFTSHDHEALIQRPKTAFDSAMPAGNGVAAVALQRLGHLLGEVRYLEAARRTLECFWPQMRRQAGGFSTMLQALEEALTPPAITILRGPAAEVGDWQRRLGGRGTGLVLSLPNDISDLHPALAKPQSDHVNAWVCRGVTCLPPATDFEALLGHLQSG